MAGSSAWFDASRGVLYLWRNPTRDEWLLECIKANYGRTGWDAQLKVDKSNGKFCGFVQAEALDGGEVKSLKAKGAKAAKEQAKEQQKHHGKSKKIPDFMED